jgi:hypothetical protein
VFLIRLEATHKENKQTKDKTRKYPPTHMTKWQEGKGKMQQKPGFPTSQKTCIPWIPYGGPGTGALMRIERPKMSAFGWSSCLPSTTLCIKLNLSQIRPLLTTAMATTSFLGYSRSLTLVLLPHNSQGESKSVHITFLLKLLLRLLVFLFCRYWGLNPWSHTCYTDHLLL